MAGGFVAGVGVLAGPCEEADPRLSADAVACPADFFVMPTTAAA